MQPRQRAGVRVALSSQQAPGPAGGVAPALSGAGCLSSRLRDPGHGYQAGAEAGSTQAGGTVGVTLGSRAWGGRTH